MTIHGSIRGVSLALAVGCGAAIGWLLHDARPQPALAALLQGQTTSKSGTLTAIAVCFGTASPPAGWSTAEATANTIASGNHRIVAVLPATAPAGCANPEIVWAQAP